MAVVYTIEFINNSGNDDRVYNVFSAKASVDGGAAVTKSVVWFKTDPLDQNQRTSIKYDNSVYAFVGTYDSDSITDGVEINTRSNWPVITGSDTDDGTILILNKNLAFLETESTDGLPVPGKEQFKIVTNAKITTPNNNVIGVSRAKRDKGNTIPVPTTIVQLKPNITYTLTVDQAVYIKAGSDYSMETVQPCPTDAGSKVVFPVNRKKATVTEDNAGKFTIKYS